LEEPELGLDPREKGKAMHAAMEIVWRELRDAATLRATSADELARLVSRAVQQALRDQRPFPGTPFEERLSALERQRLTRIVAEWLEMEKTRVGDFVVAQVESAREVEIGGLRLRTRIDRVDQLTGGQIALIDYKSGEPSVTSWEGDRPDEPQLPLYAVTQSMPVAAVAFGQVRTGAIQFKGYTARDGLLPKAKLRDEAEFAEMTDAWRTALGTLATGFREGDAAVDPKSSAECDRCHLHVLCRIADHGSPGGGA
jgi:RecB family exonuclease